MQPSSGIAGVGLNPAVAVTIEDSLDQPVSSATNAVTVALNGGPGGATLSGTTSVTAINGVATFGNLSIQQASAPTADSGYTLTASAGGLGGATSARFTIAPAAPAQLAFVVQPSPTQQAEPIWPPVQVAIQDHFGNWVVGATTAVTLALGTNPVNGTLSGTTTVNPVNGVATFATLSVDRPAAGYTLAATASSLTAATSTAFEIRLTFPFAIVSAGVNHTCGVTPAGAAYCWGLNDNGQLGNGTTTGPNTCGSTPCSPAPVAVSGGLVFTTVSAGSGYTCGLTTDNAAYCWGSNASGQLGNGTTTSSTTLVAVSGGLAFATVSAGEAHACGVTSAGAAYCWGNNANGELGNGTTVTSPTPVAVSGGLVFATVSAGSGYTCGVTTENAAYCWGSNLSGQLGNGTTTNSPTLVAVSGGLAFATVSAGYAHACGVTTAGAAYCWGANYYSQFGNGTRTGSTIPVAASGGLSFAGVSAGTSDTCGATPGGIAYCWGLDNKGQLGNGTYGPQHCLVGGRTVSACSLTPAVVSGGLTFTRVSAGSSHTCGVTKAGAVYCWGDDTYGEVGDRTAVGGTYPYPRSVSAP